MPVSDGDREMIQETMQRVGLALMSLHDLMMSVGEDPDEFETEENALKFFDRIISVTEGAANTFKDAKTTYVNTLS